MDSRPIRIYSKEDVPRLRYIAGILLGEILGLSWEVVTDKRKLGKKHVINYSSEDIQDAFKINPDSLLFETGIGRKEISINIWKGLPVFFPTSTDSDLPFDIFAASFFLVSRYEEYLDFESDQYERFPASESLAFKNGFLGIPIVDLWAKELAKVLLKRFQGLTFKRNDYKSIVTVDIDQPFAFLGKSLIRSIGGLLRDFKNNDGNAGDRYKTVAKGEKDPYQVYDYITEKIEKSKADARFFFPVGDHSQYDQSPSWKNDEYRKLIVSLADKYTTGLHPSYYAAGNSSTINNETVRLKTILKKEIIISRFHYIRLFFPQSYRNILKAGILEDYSMGYPDEPGFRAGIARPYYFYDVTEDKQTGLKIFPFQIMDATLFQYKKLDPAASKEVIFKLISETRKAGGLFVSIWHNTSLLEKKDGKEWREVFEFMLNSQET